MVAWCGRVLYEKCFVIPILWHWRHIWCNQPWWKGVATTPKTGTETGKELSSLYIRNVQKGLQMMKWQHCISWFNYASYPTSNKILPTDNLSNISVYVTWLVWKSLVPYFIIDSSLFNHGDGLDGYGHNTGMICNDFMSFFLLKFLFL